MLHQHILYNTQNNLMTNKSAAKSLLLIVMEIYLETLLIVLIIQMTPVFEYQASYTQCYDQSRHITVCQCFFGSNGVQLSVHASAKGYHD